MKDIFKFIFEFMLGWVVVDLFGRSVGWWNLIRPWYRKRLEQLYAKLQMELPFMNFINIDAPDSEENSGKEKI